MSTDTAGEPGPSDIRRLPSGAHVHVWTSPRAPRAPRALVQLQHGFAEYAERFTHQHHQLVEHLTSHGFEVWAMDLLGHGRSPGPRGQTDIRQAVEDHRLLRRAMRAHSPLPIALVGHSLGGLVTAGSLLADPEHVAGVVLLAPSLPPAVPAPARWIMDLLARVVPAAPAPLKKAPASELTRLPEQRRITAADPLLFPGRVPMRLAATALHVAAEVWEQASDTWSTPCLVVHGTADTSTEPDRSRRFVDLLPATDKSLQLVTGGRHELLHDLDGDAVLTSLLSWLDSHVPAAPSLNETPPAAVSRRPPPTGRPPLH